MKTTQELKSEITRLSNLYNIPISELESLVDLIKRELSEGKKGVSERSNTSFSLKDIKEAIYDYFRVESTPALKKSKSFKLATEGMFLRLNETDSWKVLYRKFIGVIPGEEYEEGKDCINGVNIFKYFKPWQVFGLDPKQATGEDIKEAYRKLSKIYHPDIPETGNRRVFERIEKMYRSLMTTT